MKTNPNPKTFDELLAEIDRVTEVILKDTQTAETVAEELNGVSRLLVWGNARYLVERLKENMNL